MQRSCLSSAVELFLSLLFEVDALRYMYSGLLRAVGELQEVVEPSDDVDHGFFSVSGALFGLNCTRGSFTETFSSLDEWADSFRLPCLPFAPLDKRDCESSPIPLSVAMYSSFANHVFVSFSFVLT